MTRLQCGSGILGWWIVRLTCFIIRPFRLSIHSLYTSVTLLTVSCSPAWIHEKVHCGAGAMTVMFRRSWFRSHMFPNDWKSRVTICKQRVDTRLGIKRTIEIAIFNLGPSQLVTRIPYSKSDSEKTDNCRSARSISLKLAIKNYFC